METGNTNALLDHLVNYFSLKNDAALAKRLGIDSPVICKLRKGTPLGAIYVLRINEAFQLPIEEIKTLAGIRTFLKEAA
jgi:hypothetical protein